METIKHLTIARYDEQECKLITSRVAVRREIYQGMYNRVVIRHIGGKAPMVTSRLLANCLLAAGVTQDEIDEYAKAQTRDIAVEVRVGQWGSTNYLVRERKSDDLRQYPVVGLVHESMEGKLNEEVKIFPYYLWLVMSRVAEIEAQRFQIDTAEYTVIDPEEWPFERVPAYDLDGTAKAPDTFEMKVADAARAMKNGEARALLYRAWTTLDNFQYRDVIEFANRFANSIWPDTDNMCAELKARVEAAEKAEAAENNNMPMREFDLEPA